MTMPKGWKPQHIHDRSMRVRDLGYIAQGPAKYASTGKKGGMSKSEKGRLVLLAIRGSILLGVGICLARLSVRLIWGV